MLQNAYFLAKIGADTAENEQHFAEILPTDALCRLAGTIYLLPFEESGPAGKVGCYPDLELLRSMVEAWSHKLAFFWCY